MKVRKSLVLLAILAVAFSLTGCSSSSASETEFNKNDMVGMTYDKLTEIINYTAEESAYEIHTADEAIANAIANEDVAVDECGEFVSLDENDYVYKDKGEEVEIIYTAQYKTRKVEFDCIIVENPDAEWDPEAEQFVFSSITVSPIYSFNELMGKAAANTLMGMGTVFAVLIFISIIISLFKFIPNGETKKAKAKAEASKKTAEDAVKKAAPQSAPVANTNLMDDAQLVAVITAAIAAYEGANGGAVSKDKLIVRSIKRARR